MMHQPIAATFFFIRNKQDKKTENEISSTSLLNLLSFYSYYKVLFIIFIDGRNDYTLIKLIIFIISILNPSCKIN